MVEPLLDYLHHLHLLEADNAIYGRRKSVTRSCMIKFAVFRPESEPCSCH